MSNFGALEGEVCWRNGCQGVIACHPVEGCSCHINPPCSARTDPKEHCPVCGWEARDELRRLNDHIETRNRSFPNLVPTIWTPRPLDPRKLDWHSKEHTHSSMIKEGVYPLYMSQADVESKVRGTFGGRFAYFADGKFKYIAYTD